jgi:hypothetical protein
MTVKFSQVLSFFALDKPWLYSCLASFLAMWVIVILGNPQLPIPQLAKYGWAWHHVPEFSGFLFLGIWFGDFKIQSGKRIGWADAIYLAILTAMSLIETFSFTLLVVVPVVTVPSLIGYIAKRWFTIKKPNPSQ